MKVILASSKTMKLREVIAKVPQTQPIYQSDANELVAKLKKFSISDLAKHLKCSSALASEASNFYKDFENKEIIKSPALSIFSGQVFSKIEIEKMTEKHWQYACDSIVIVSGLYGFLRATDLISPYRLEMATKIPSIDLSLTDFWAQKLDKLPNIDSKFFPQDQDIINLASEEYFGPFKKAKFKRNLIKVEFLENISGKLKSIGIYAKQARGEMVDFLIKAGVQNAVEIKEFNELGYSFSKQDSTKSRYVFTRKKVA